MISAYQFQVFMPITNICSIVVYKRNSWSRFWLIIFEASKYLKIQFYYSDLTLNLLVGLRLES